MDLILRVCGGLASRLRKVWLCSRGVSFQGSAWLKSIRVPRHPDHIHLEDGVALDEGIVLLISSPQQKSPTIRIGKKTYINRYTILDASVGIDIGQECMVGPFCYITDHDHTFGADGTPSAGELIFAPTKLEDRCWIGAHVTILKGVVIGTGAVVGAGAVVTKSIPPYSVAVGNPAQVIRTRSQ